MAWVKIPAENHPLFHAALPTDKGVSTLHMFGGVAGMVNGNMFSGLFGRSFLVKLSEAHQKVALALDGAERFDPMRNGRVMRDTIFMPESAMDDAAEFRSWLQKAFDYTKTLPAKKKKKKKKKDKAKPTLAKTAKAKKPTPKARKPASKKSAKPARKSAQQSKR